MKRIKTKNLYLLLCILCTATVSQNLAAQSSNVRKAAKSVFTLTTFKRDGTLLASTHGVFIGNNGEAVSSWKPFVGADSAVVVDANGKATNVDVMIGANELYDVCKFKVEGNTTPIKIAQSPAKPGDKVWLLGYSIQTPDISQMTIQKVETFMERYSYYIFAVEAPENAADCPFVNAKGELIGILQHASSSNDVHAIDAAFMNNMQVSKGLTVASPLLRQTAIRTQMPDNEEQALVMLMVAGEQNAKNYRKYINDFIKLFPTAVDGYAAQARQYVNNRQFDLAAQEMEKAIRQATHKDQAHSEYAKIIYQQQVYQPDSTFTQWSLDKALEQATQAYQIKPDPAYQHQIAQIIFIKGEYQRAYDLFMSLTQTPLRSGELFYEAAQSKTQLKADRQEILALLDSAVAACPQPLTVVAAPFVLARGIALDEAGEYRKALADYNRYDTLMLGRADHTFYYTRYKCEVQLHRYQQALNDIAHAALLNTQEPTYLAEMASLQLKVNRFEDAIKTADICIEAAPNYPDIYLIKGLAQIQNNQKAEGLETLKKAKELGDARAQNYIDKYKSN